MAADGGGSPPGRVRFESAAGIKMGAWYGVYWARWSDALTEAGFVANKSNTKIDPDVLLEHLAQACRHYGKIPSSGELQLYERQEVGFPSHTTFSKAFPSKAAMLNQLAIWVNKNDTFIDVGMLLTSDPSSDSIPAASAHSTSEGHVYLIQSGTFYKIGRSDDIERRVREIRITLPDKTKLVHTIRTDDPAGIEAYWHRRFQDRRANGEWFKLLSADLAAFRKRRYQ